MRHLTTIRRHLFLLAVLLTTAACSPPEAPARADAFTIETDRLTIRVEGDPQAFELHAGQILTRIDTVDPQLIRPGIGIWAVEGIDEGLTPVGDSHLVRIGTVIAVEPRAGGY